MEKMSELSISDVKELTQGKKSRCKWNLQCQYK